MRTRPQLLTDPVGTTLFRLSAPMALGVTAVITFNLVDTFFVAQLGTLELAALSFTFPVVFSLFSISMGLGMGTASVVARAIGEGDRDKTRRLTTDSLILSFCIVLCGVILGLLTIDPLFRLLGASDQILSLIREYMVIYYIGIAFVVIPMVGNNAIRATGDTVFPSLIMIIGAIINLILDPILIFGLFGFPRLEMRGAALATVIARAGTLIAALYILHFRDHLLDFKLQSVRLMWQSWKQILFIGLPTAGTNILMPVSLGIITRMAAIFGPAAVAAVGVGSRIEAFALIPVMSLGSALVPFIGQNWGAVKLERVHRAHWLSHRFSLWLGVGFALFCLVGSAWLATLLSSDHDVIQNIQLFLWIVPLGFGLQGSVRLVASAFNAINKPFLAALVSLVRIFCFYIPFAWLGAFYYDLTGMFIGMMIANVLSGVAAMYTYHARCTGRPTCSD